MRRVLKARLAATWALLPAKRILIAMAILIAFLVWASLARAEERPPFKTFTEAAAFTVDHRVLACASSPDESMDWFLLWIDGRYYVLMSKAGRWVLFRITGNGVRRNTTEPEYVWIGALSVSEKGQPDDTLRVTTSMTGTEAQTYSNGPCTWLAPRQNGLRPLG